MKHHIVLILWMALSAFPLQSKAEINVPGDGSDGVFAPASNVTIDLSEATTGTWDGDNSARAGRGIYDAEKWAIVFKFASVTVPTNVTVNFKNHPSRAPVVWLVKGDVVIGGAVSLDGEAESGDASLLHINPEGGPGGFRGGLSLNSHGSGLGPAAGHYASSYGSPQILPLIGGPGSEAYRTLGYNRWPGGGGAILIGSRTRVVLDGRITARGGSATHGGAIKLICDEVAGGGRLDVSEGGRLRIEANSLKLTHPTLADYFATPPGPTPVIWPPADAPRARIVSVDGMPTPAEPLAQLNGQPDIMTQTTNEIEVVVETLNFPVEGSVSLRVIPKYANARWVSASLTEGSFARALWVARTKVGQAYTTFQVRAAAP